MNTLSNNSMECVPDTSVTSVVFPCLYSVLFLVALVLNSMAAWIFYKIPTTSTFMVYLKNVVVADMLMTLTIPVKVLNDAGVGSLRLRVFYCQYSNPLFHLSMYANILFLGLISLDRYLKIVRPFGRYAVQKVRVGQVLSATVWVVMLSLALPIVILADKPPQLSGGEMKCINLWSGVGLQLYKAAHYGFQVLFWGTLVLMLFCYTFISRKVYQSYKASRSSSEVTSRRTKAKVFIVVAVFFICFALLHLAQVPFIILNLNRNKSNHCRSWNIIYISYETAMWLATMNVCLDPLIYIFLCKMFRRHLKATLSRKTLTQGKMEMCVTVCDRNPARQMTSSSDSGDVQN